MPRRILVIRLGAMGDIIHTLPAVTALRESFPESQISWMVEEKWMPLLADSPAIDRLEVVNRRSFDSILRLRRELRERETDLAIDFQGLLKSAIAGWFARPADSIGLSRAAARESLATLFYRRHVTPKRTHVVERNLELAEAAGARVQCVVFPLGQGRPEGALPSGRYVLANPGAGWVSKQWPLENYSRLAEMLHARGIPLVLNGPVAIEAPGTTPHASGLAGLIDATRRATAVVGVDSGPIHLAAALGKPGVAIFGPTDPARNGPYGGTIAVLRDPAATTTYQRGSVIDPAMRAVTPEQVWSRLEPLLL